MTLLRLDFVLNSKDLLSYWVEKYGRVFEKTLNKNLGFFNNFLILEFCIISTPFPIISIYLQIFLNFLITFFNPKKIDSPIIKWPMLNSDIS